MKQTWNILGPRRGVVGAPLEQGDVIVRLVDGVEAFSCGGSSSKEGTEAIFFGWFIFLHEKIQRLTLPRAEGILTQDIDWGVDLVQDLAVGLAGGAVRLEDVCVVLGAEI